MNNKKERKREANVTKVVYVDELAGCDTNGQGSEAAPFKSILKAIELKGEDIKIQIKKDAEGFKDISGAAFKKAKKTFAEQQKKAKKLLEQQKKQEEELKKKLEDEAKALEHAKSIVLTEDKSLPVAEKVKKKKSIGQTGEITYFCETLDQNPTID